MGLRIDHDPICIRYRGLAPAGLLEDIQRPIMTSHASLMYRLLQDRQKSTQVTGLVTNRRVHATAEH